MYLYSVSFGPPLSLFVGSVPGIGRLLSSDMIQLPGSWTSAAEPKKQKGVLLLLYLKCEQNAHSIFMYMKVAYVRVKQGISRGKLAFKEGGRDKCTLPSLKCMKPCTKRSYPYFWQFLIVALYLGHLSEHLYLLLPQKLLCGHSQGLTEAAQG